MTLPLFDLYKTPYKKGNITIKNYDDAISQMAETGYEPGLEHNTDYQLESSESISVWKKSMPKETPEVLRIYQDENRITDLQTLTNTIDEVGCILSENQKLLHGGDLSINGETDRPLSTTFDPQVAFREAEFKGKAFDEGALYINILEVKNPKTNVFYFGRESEHDNEKEVLFASGAEIVEVERRIIKSEYEVYDSKAEKTKKVPVILVRKEIS